MPEKFFKDKRYSHPKMTMNAEEYPDYCFTNTGGRTGKFIYTATPEFLTTLARNLRSGMSLKWAFSNSNISAQYGLTCYRAGRTIINHLNDEGTDVNEWLADEENDNTEKAYVRMTLVIEQAQADSQVTLLHSVYQSALEDGQLALNFLKSRFPSDYTNGRTETNNTGTIEIKVDPDEIAKRLRDILDE